MTNNDQSDPIDQTPPEYIDHEREWPECEREACEETQIRKGGDLTGLCLEHFKEKVTGSGF